MGGGGGTVTATTVSVVHDVFTVSNQWGGGGVLLLPQLYLWCMMCLL